MKVVQNITRDNLPKGTWYEADGSAWKCELDEGPHNEKGWRWAPLNWEAFGKPEPQGVMNDFVMPNALS